MCQSDFEFIPKIKRRLKTALKSPDPKERSNYLFYATECLDFQDCVVSIIIESLKDPDALVRDTCVFLLQHVQSPVVLKALLNALVNEYHYKTHPSYFVYVESFLGQDEKQTITAMLKLFKTGSDYCQTIAGEYLTLVLAQPVDQVFSPTPDVDLRTVEWQGQDLL